MEVFTMHISVTFGIALVGAAIGGFVGYRTGYLRGYLRASLDALKAVKL